MEYRIYEHITGFPDHMDSIFEPLETALHELEFTADEAENFIKEFVDDTDQYGNKRRVYVYRIK